jgi:uncharacterized GH25 family protein
MKKIIVYTFVALLSFVSIATAKRVYVEYPDSVISNGIEYKATYDEGWLFHDVFIEAIDTKSKARIWKKKIYSTLMNPILEHDVQFVVITSVVLKDGKLFIENEKNSHYILDTKTQKLVKE